MFNVFKTNNVQLLSFYSIVISITDLIGPSATQFKYEILFIV